MLFSWKHTRGALCCHIFISATKTFTGHMFQSIELYSYWHICQSWMELKWSSLLLHWTTWNWRKPLELVKIL